jgi:hypothetical protein
VGRRNIKEIRRTKTIATQIINKIKGVNRKKRFLLSKRRVEDRNLTLKLRMNSKC